MMRRASYILGSGLVNLAQSGSSCSQPATALLATVISTRAFRAVADFEIDFSNRETLKKYVGVRDHLSKEHGTRKRLIDALNVLMKELEVLPPSSEYRRAVEASTNYRLQVCEANDSDPAIEEVLDAHIEELIKECREESRIIPVMLSECGVAACMICHVHPASIQHSSIYRTLIPN